TSCTPWRPGAGRPATRAPWSTRSSASRPFAASLWPLPRWRETCKLASHVAAASADFMENDDAEVAHSHRDCGNPAGYGACGRPAAGAAVAAGRRHLRLPESRTSGADRHAGRRVEQARHQSEAGRIRPLRRRAHRAAGGFARRRHVGPADLAIALSQGSTNVMGLMGVGSSPKYVIGRNGVKLDSWSDLKGKKIAIAPGSAVWFQFAATLVENNVPYNSFEAINIQGGGANFDQALKKGEVDGLVTWETFESIPVMDGYGYFAKGLEYGSSKAVGAELGMFMTTKTAIDAKRAAIERF